MGIKYYSKEHVTWTKANIRITFIIIAAPLTFIIFFLLQVNSPSK